MEENKGSGGRKGGLKLGLGLGGGGGVVVLVGGAIVAAAVWSICEFMKRRNPSSNKGTLKDFQTPNSEKVKNVDGGGDGLSADLLESETEEKDTSGGSDASGLQLFLNVEKISEFGLIKEEEIEEGKKIDDDVNVAVDENTGLIEKSDDVTCETVVHGTMQEAVEFCDNSMDHAYALSSDSADELVVSKDESGSGSQVEEETRLIAEKIDSDSEVRGVVIKSATPDDDGSYDVVSEDLEYEGIEGSEGNSGGTTDSSSPESNSKTEAVWPAESLESALSQAIKDDKNLNVITNEIAEVENNEKLSSHSAEMRSIVNETHHNVIHDHDVSTSKDQLGSAMKNQTVNNSTNTTIWASTVLLALLVLIAALIIQQKYLSISDFPMK